MALKLTRLNISSLQIKGSEYMSVTNISRHMITHRYSITALNQKEPVFNFTSYSKFFYYIRRVTHCHFTISYYYHVRNR